MTLFGRVLSIDGNSDEKVSENKDSEKSGWAWR